MEDVQLIEKVNIFPEKQTEHRRIYLSNIDLALVVYQESTSFFNPPDKEMSFSEACQCLYKALSQLLVEYDFWAGRLVLAEKSQRLEIDCNGAGIVVAAARTNSSLAQLGDLMAPKPEFKQLVAFCREENEEEIELKDKPLLFLQMTQFGCGSFAMSSRYNHCVMDGVAVREFEANLAAQTRGKDLITVPNPDRTVFKARDPPQINHQHYEYSKPIDGDISFTARGTRTVANTSSLQSRSHLFHISLQRIADLKNAALKDGKLKNCTTFQAIAAKVWKARSIALEMEEERISTMIFPVDARKRVEPPAPAGFAGNALIPGFARATVRDLKEEEFCVLVEKVKVGVERLDDEYVRSGIDWLEMNGGVPCRIDSFSLVSWWRLGLEEEEFVWGRVKCTVPIVVKPGLVMLLPGGKEEGGLYVCLDLPEDQLKEFGRILLED